MKKFFILLLIGSGFSADAQTLKELLYSGKLKKDSSAVIRKTDDLSTKIDTSTRKTPNAVVAAKPVVVTDTARAVNAAAKETDAVGPVTQSKTEATEVTESVIEKATPVATKSNTKLWKEYTDELTAGLKDVLNNKKIKKDTYFFVVDYEIDEKGQTSINGVTVSPENSQLLDQVRERILTTPPALNPVLGSDGQPRKVKRKQSFSVVKG
ncbi:MAG: hypothetical protein ACXWV0_08300 [Flavisolibacter sp.]